MAKPKGSQTSTVKLARQPKKTRQGQGQHSKPSHGRKKNRGQG